jgi:3-oxoacyl-[acyl-carrier protein] reductase
VNAGLVEPLADQRIDGVVGLHPVALVAGRREGSRNPAPKPRLARAEVVLARCHYAASEAIAQLGRNNGRVDAAMNADIDEWGSFRNRCHRPRIRLGGQGRPRRSAERGKLPRLQANRLQEKTKMGVLDDKVAIVTGSARGIGRATAEILIEHGAKVLINDLDGDVAEQTASELGGETVVFAGDLTDPAAPAKLVKTAVDAWGKIDIIVNNAGYTLDAPVHKMSDDWFQRMLDIHVVAPFRIVREAAPYLREPAKAEKEEGVEVFRKIVNVSSISGTMGNAGQANYAAGKAAVVGLTKTLAKEWGQFKINCNAVAFGYIETRLTASKDEANTMEIDGEKVQLGIPDQMRGMASMLIPIGRPGTPEEAAGGVFFLCSPWSNYVHGQTLNITGGQFTGMTT